MKDLIIIGASGFGREVAWLVERINRINPTWHICGFIDDNLEIKDSLIGGYTVLGDSDSIINYKDAYFVCAIGSSKVREMVINKVTGILPEIKFATLLDPSVEFSERVSIGEGTIVCAHTIITVDIKIGKHNIINLDCTIGHDAVLEDYLQIRQKRSKGINRKNFNTNRISSKICTR